MGIFKPIEIKKEKKKDTEIRYTYSIEIKKLNRQNPKT